MAELAGEKTPPPKPTGYWWDTGGRPRKRWGVVDGPVPQSVLSLPGFAWDEYTSKNKNSGDIGWASSPRGWLFGPLAHPGHLGGGENWGNFLDYGDSYYRSQESWDADPGWVSWVAYCPRVKDDEGKWVINSAGGWQNIASGWATSVAQAKEEIERAVAKWLQEHPDAETRPGPRQGVLF